MSNDNIKVSTIVKLYAGDVLIAEIDSAALFLLALDFIQKQPIEKGPSHE